MQYVRTQLAEGCWPDQIAGRLHRVQPHDMRKYLEDETIYVGLYVLPRGVLRNELLAARVKHPGHADLGRREQIHEARSLI